MLICCAYLHLISLVISCHVAGVDIEVLEEAALAAGKASDTVSVSRSNTVLLIKNLPYKSDGDELLGML